ncbi:hypothetical protein BED46_031155 [Burkholderia contaminans]|nr:hypothetical protein BED46_031155 [Burkholderia contaminans]
MSLTANKLIACVTADILLGQTTPASLPRKLIEMPQQFLIATSRACDEVVVQMGARSADLVAVTASETILSIPSLPFGFQ